MATAETTRSTTVTRPSDREIVITRAFDAPRQLVFDAWIDPEHPPHWMLGPEGEASLLELFDGRRQLIVCHFMWLWEEGQPLDEGCPSCTAGADEVSDGLLKHLHARGAETVGGSYYFLDRSAPGHRETIAG